MVRHRLRVDGMACTGCEATIKREISDISDVEEIDADYETGMVELTSTSAATGGYVEQAVNDLGYEVTEYTII
jgi:copper chaperone